MSVWFNVVRISAAVNVVVLLGLAAIWGRNYLEFRSKHTLGLSVFAVFLVLENALRLYMYIVDPTLSAWFSSEVPNIAWRAMMLLHVLETLGLLFLAWVTFD